MGPVDDMDITWFNGNKVGETMEEGKWSQPRSYSIPGNVVKNGKAVLTIRVIDTGGEGGLLGNKNALKIYPDGAGSTDTIHLAGEWKYFIELVKNPTVIANNPNVPTVLYNGMIAPLVPFAIKGAIWYQGESNVGRAEQYEKLLPYHDHELA